MFPSSLLLSRLGLSKLELLGVEVVVLQKLV
jgi:hypothetical protein